MFGLFDWCHEPSAKSIFPEAEQMHGRHTQAAGIAIVEHLLSTGDNLRDDQKVDIQYLLETLRHMKNGPSADECAHDCILTSNLDRHTEQFLLNFSNLKKEDSVAMRKVKNAIGQVRLTHRIQKAKLADIPVELSAEGVQRTELDKLDSWSEFNIFRLAEDTNCPLKLVAFKTLDVRGLLKTFGCDMQMTLAFFTKVEEMYVDCGNPYHNNIHAADVIQGVHSILCHTTMKVALTELEIFSLLLAAVGHDIAHPGLTNDFIMNAGDDMALTYNDSSVNENMHCSVFCRLLQRPEYRFLQTLSSAQRVAVRKDIIHCILGTDMASHFRNFKIFTDLIQNNGTDLTN